MARTGISSRFVSSSRPFSRILEAAGFKTLEEGHARHLADRTASEFKRRRLRIRPISAGPGELVRKRRRVAPNSRPANQPLPFINHIVRTWHLPRERLQVLTDAHCYSSVTVDLPL
jgi:hypothetical protein